MKLLQRFLRETSFLRQIGLVVTTGVIAIALLSSLTTSWMGSERIRRTLGEQGAQITDNLARQSRLALLYDSADNAEGAISVTLAFPDVVGLEIRHGDGRLLVARGSLGPDVALLPQPGVQRGSRLERETAEGWRFAAPVYARELEDSPFEAGEQAPELLGYVRVAQSKDTLTRMIADVFLVNFLISFSCAFLVLLGLRVLGRRLSQPLSDLASAMARAGAGEARVRAELSGARDIAGMAHTFNGMMVALEEREQQLRDARDAAVRFARLKAEFAATVSHEIRTPLNGVLGTLEILLASRFPRRQHQYLEIAWESARYLLELINNILDFSRLEAGRLQIESVEFEPLRLLEDVIDVVTPQAGQKGLDLGYLAEAGLPARLRGDSQRIRQVLVNLLGNAVKFTEAGEVAASVCCVERPAAGGWRLRFQVRDSGIGISAEQRARIFDSFTQADTSTTRRYGGSGLGLSISRQLVELMGGRIGVDSSPGEGSCFWFELVLDEVAGEAPPAATPLAGPAPAAALVAAPAAVVRDFLRQGLAQAGYECRAVATAEALPALLAAGEGEPWGLLMVDAAWCGDTGLIPLLNAARRQGARLVVLAGYGEDEPAGGLEADAYLSKPLRLERLRACLAGFTPSPAAAAGVAPPPLALAAPRVLVVEDNRSNQAIARGMLQMLGCVAGVAADGREALQMVGSEAWDLVLMDCNMPDMDGFEATAALRVREQQQGQGRLPVVAMTANAGPADVEKCLAAGMDDHLAKPLTLDALVTKLRRWLPAPVAYPARVVDDEDEEVPAPPPLPLDPQVFDKLRDALGDAVGEAIRPFLEDMPEYLEELERAAVAGDREGLCRVAHAVKGAAGNLGAGVLAAVAREVEESAPEEGGSGLAGPLSRLRSEYALVREALLAELAEPMPHVPARRGDGALVLVVDDDRSTRSALRHALLRSGFRVEEADNGADALAALERIAPDVILMDALMPVMDGFTACARLQRMPQGRDIPVLMITALEDSHSIERAFAVGALDYIPKPIHLPVVNQRVRRVVEATRAQRHVRHLAFNDALTGLPNRVQFSEHLNRAIIRARGGRLAVAVLFLDLDRFKFVNDTLGHEIGDKLLKSVAGRIRHCVRAGDCVARQGGDEFTVLLEDLADTAPAATVAESICRSLAAPFEIDGHDIFVSASIGISLFPGDGEDLSTLLRHADTAMYRAKKGAAGFEFYEHGMETTVTEHLRLESALRRALERDELEVHYQPTADLASGQLTGMEALLRWRHPGRGLVSPAEFIPLAEETGLIVPIGEWVLRTACAQTRAWRDAGAPPLKVAVNLSGNQLQAGNFIQLLSSVLEDTGLPAAQLTLEITESVLMDHARETMDALHQMKALGLSLAIDDFGTGYSSLAYLKRFPVDVLKVDRSFVRDIAVDPDDAAIVRGIIALAHSLRLKVVAEGVETGEQRDFLAAHGCDILQGYLLGKPMPAAEFEERMLRPRYPCLTPT